MARKHGHTSGGGCWRSITYNTWRCMLERCNRPGHKWWPRYGGRGIAVCEEWHGKNGFATFLQDMGERPEKSITLERIDGNGNYCKANCRWATKSEQRLNQERPYHDEIR